MVTMCTMCVCADLDLRYTTGDESVPGISPAADRLSGYGSG